MLLGRISIIFLALFWISNCGGEAAQSIITVAPSEPFVLNTTRTFPLAFDEVLTLEKPNTQFQLRINNTGKNGNRPITIIAASVTVDGPKGRKRIDLDPLISLFSINAQGAFNFVSRSYFVEVPAYQASYCLNKITDFRRPNNTEPCAAISNDDAGINIPNFGVSAAGLIDNTDPNLCCPSGIRSLENIFILVPKIQDYNSNETIPPGQTYGATLEAVGFYGNFSTPTANFLTTVPFTMRSF